jgi:hypothetical protein
MLKPRWVATIAGVALVTVATPLTAQTPDHAAVHRAVLDYVEGFYNGDSTLHIRSIRPEVYKYGFSRNPQTGAYTGAQFTWQQFGESTAEVREGGEAAPPNAPREIVIFDVLDQTASAKLTAAWGVDYLLLGKYDGKWMISHVLWQTPPPKS